MGALIAYNMRLLQYTAIKAKSQEKFLVFLLNSTNFKSHTKKCCFKAYSMVK